jgi:dipeptidase
MDPTKYQKASEVVLNKFPYWKREAVKDDISNKNYNSRVMDEFAKEVVAIAEQAIAEQDIAEQDIAEQELVVTDSKTNEKSNFVISNLTKQSLTIKVKMINGVYFVDIK